MSATAYIGTDLVTVVFSDGRIKPFNGKERDNCRKVFKLPHGCIAVWAGLLIPQQKQVLSKAIGKGPEEAIKTIAPQLQELAHSDPELVRTMKQHQDHFFMIETHGYVDGALQVWRMESSKSFEPALVDSLPSVDFSKILDAPLAGSYIYPNARNSDNWRELLGQALEKRNVDQMLFNTLVTGKVDMQVKKDVATAISNAAVEAFTIILKASESELVGGKVFSEVIVNPKYCASEE